MDAAQVVGPEHTPAAPLKFLENVEDSASFSFGVGIGPLHCSGHYKFIVLCEHKYIMSLHYKSMMLCQYKYIVLFN